MSRISTSQETTEEKSGPFLNLMFESGHKMLDIPLFLDITSALVHLLLSSRGSGRK